MNRLVFYNHFHNGDIVHAKEFVRDISEQLDLSITFAHDNSPTLLADLPKVKHSAIPLLLWDKYKNRAMHYIDHQGVETLGINTHIGAHFGQGYPYDYECTLRFNMGMWEDMYGKLSDVYGTKLVFKDQKHYIPKINFDMFEKVRIQNFDMTEKRKKVLVCNGPVQSGQANYNGDMGRYVQLWAQKYPNIVFVLTHMIDLNMQNVCFSSQIIGINGCDLNEIGYLSTFCDMIIGRNSGPFCFAVNQENVSDPTKKFLSFGKSETDAFLLGMETQSEYIFFPDIMATTEIEKRLDSL